MAGDAGVTFDSVREMALAFPGVEEGTSFGTPALRVRKKLLARLREDGETLVVKVGLDEREFWMATQPETFYITDHYAGYPAMLVRLATVHPGDMQILVDQAWRGLASKQMLKEFDQSAGSLAGGDALV
jgi:hypothetical protein